MHPSTNNLIWRIQNMGQLLTLEQVAEMLQVSNATVARLRKSGALPAPKQIGPRAIRWTRESIEEWLASK